MSDGRDAQPGHDSRVRDLAWSTDGKHLASADTNVKVWDVTPSGQSRETHDLKGHTRPVEKLRALGPRLFASVAEAVRVWDVRSGNGKCAQKFALERDGLSLASHPNGNLVAACDKNDDLWLFDRRKERHLARLAIGVEARAQVNDAAWDPRGGYLFLALGYHLKDGSDNKGNISKGGVAVVSATDGALATLGCFPAHTTSCYNLRFAPNGGCFALGGADGLVTLWDPSTLVCTGSLERSDTAIRDTAFSGDGLSVAYASDDKTAFVDEVATQRAIAKMPVSVTGVESLAWHPSLSILAYCGHERGSSAGFVHVAGAYFAI